MDCKQQDKRVRDKGWRSRVMAVMGKGKGGGRRGRDEREG